MSRRVRVVIPNADYFKTLPLRWRLFYLSLVGALAENASELRFEVGELGRSWCKVNGVDHEIVPQQRVEKLVCALLAGCGPETVPSELLRCAWHVAASSFDLTVGTKSTEVRVCQTSSAFVLSFAPCCEIVRKAEAILRTVVQSNIMSQGDKDLFLEGL
jgi:hypothetical protein